MQNLVETHCSTHLIILNVMATQCKCSLNSVYYPQRLLQWSCHCSHMRIPVHSPWLPGYIYVAQTILFILTVARLCPDKPRIFGEFFKKGLTDLENNASILEFGNHWSSSNLSFYRGEGDSSVSGLKKLNICIIIFPFTKSHSAVFSPGRCIVFWPTGRCSGHDSVFSVVVLCSLQRPNTGRKSRVPVGGCLLLFYLLFLWLTCAFSLLALFVKILEDR